MPLRRASTGADILLDTSKPLGKGGEASVFAVAQDAALAAKIYHQPRPAHMDKLAAMIARPPEHTPAPATRISRGRSTGSAT